MLKWLVVGHRKSRDEYRRLELSRSWSSSDKGTLDELYHCFLPRFLFLSETKNNRSFLQDVQVSFGYDRVYTVDPCGRSGGLALFYMDDPAVSILYADKHMIDIESTCEGHAIYMTFVYGDPVIKKS